MPDRVLFATNNDFGNEGSWYPSGFNGFPNGPFSFSVGDNGMSLLTFVELVWRRRSYGFTFAFSGGGDRYGPDGQKHMTYEGTGECRFVRYGGLSNLTPDAIEATRETDLTLIPDTSISHFLRGTFTGDGTIVGYDGVTRAVSVTGLLDIVYTPYSVNSAGSSFFPGIDGLLFISAPIADGVRFFHVWSADSISVSAADPSIPLYTHYIPMEFTNPFVPSAPQLPDDQSTITDITLMSSSTLPGQFWPYAAKDGTPIYDIDNGDRLQDPRN